MNKIVMSSLGCIVTMTLAASPAAIGAELLTNPGFEDTDSDGGYGDGWGCVR